MQRTAYPTQATANLYIIINLLAALVCGGAAFALQEQLGPMVGLVFIPVMFIPLISAYLLHKRDGGGGPFKGLVWGPTGWYWALAGLGLVWGALVVGAQLALGLAGFDPEMAFYIEFSKEMAAQQGAPEGGGGPGDGMYQMIGWVTAGSSLVLGPWLGALFGSLSSFPLLGFLMRRLLVKGRIPAIIIIMAFSAAGSAVAGLIDNPNLGETALPVRIGLYMVLGLAGIPAMSWVFFKTRSAVLPALLTASYTSALTAATPFLSDYAPWITSGNGGLAASLGSLLLGLALWVWQDPGSGSELAAAAFGNDGTPLTPEQYEQALAYQTGRAGAGEPGAPQPPGALGE